MAAELITIPCLKDNYAFLLRDGATGEVALVDAPEAAPILAELARRRWPLSQIFITHHHSDHIDGVAEIVAATGAKVTGARADAHRLPPLDRQVAEGDSVAVGGLTGTVIDVSGHTVGHIAFHFPAANAVFTADSLMAMGCGRLSEGNAPMMWASLSKLAALPSTTLVCSGHEYTASNARFALTIEPDSADLRARVAEIEASRATGRSTVPSSLATELATNPFLRAGLEPVKAAVGMAGLSAADVFGEIRARKDRF